jgi:restriction system protein
LYEEESPLFDYTEPINSRISRKADALDDGLQVRFGELRRKHNALVFALPSWHMELMLGHRPVIPQLPLRDSLVFEQRSGFGPLPDEVLDAKALRPLMDAIRSQTEAALAEFDEVFGERA